MNAATAAFFPNCPPFGADPAHPRVRIPRLDAERQGLYVEEEFLPQVGRYSGTTWVVDLSEYQDGITLSLARMLERLNEEARRRGCSLQFYGTPPAAAH